MVSENITIDWIQLLIAAVALYGAVLATYTFWMNQRYKQRRLKVELSHAFAPNSDTSLESLVTIRVSNPSYQSVTASSVSLELPDKRQVVYPNPRSDKPPPHELTPGTNLTVLVNARELAQSLTEAGYSGVVQLVGVCSDAVGDIHRSKPFDFDTNVALSRD